MSPLHTATLLGYALTPYTSHGCVPVVVMTRSVKINHVSAQKLPFSQLCCVITHVHVLVMINTSHMQKFMENFMKLTVEQEILLNM